MGIVGKSESSCERCRTVRHHVVPATRPRAPYVPVPRSHRKRSRQFSSSLPARRLIGSAPRRWSRRAGKDRNPWGLTFDNEESAEQ
jgi:hypothetical protein